MLYNNNGGILRFIVVLLFLILAAPQVFAEANSSSIYLASNGESASITKPVGQYKHYNVYTPNTNYLKKDAKGSTVADYLKRFKQLDNSNKFMPSQKGLRINGDAVEIVMDYSTSMASWINLTQDILVYLLPKLPTSTSVGIRVIAGDTRAAGYTTISGCANTLLVIPVQGYTLNRNADIVKGLSKVFVGGNTPLTYSLYSAVENDLGRIEVAPGKTKKIIMITDGGETCVGDPCVYINDAVKKFPDITIDVIQIGENSELRCLTTATNGNFFRVYDDKQRFENAFEDAFKVPKGLVKRERELEPKRLDNLINKLGIERNPVQTLPPPRLKKGSGPDTSLDKLTHPQVKGYKFIETDDVDIDDEE